ncbi:MAG: DUF4374 domain-containing protein [Bacteroidota bacterium]
MKIFSFLAALLLTVSIQAQQYSMMTLTGNTVLGQKASYVQGIKLGPTSYTNSNATELSGEANIKNFDGNMYVTMVSGGNKISKYTPQANGQMKLEKTIAVTAATNVIDLCFINKDLALAENSFEFKLHCFNPTTMTVTGEIFDLSSLMNSTYNSSAITEVTYRDGKLFVGVLYRKYTGGINTTLLEECHIAVCDVATRKLEKVIKDSRTLPSGYPQSSASANFIDEQGDLYLIGQKTYDASQTTVKNAAILRIKKGSTEFDSEYFFDIQAACGNRPVVALRHAGGNKAFVVVFYKEKTNPLNPYSAYDSPVWKYWAVDLQAKTAREMTMDFHKGLYNNWLVPTANGKVLAPLVTASANAVYELDHETAKVAYKFSTNGEPYGVYEFKAFNPNGINAVQKASFSAVQHADFLVVNSEKELALTANWYNLNGQLVQSQQLNVTAGENRFSSALPLGPGIYSLRIEHKGSNESVGVKWVK